MRKCRKVIENLCRTCLEDFFSGYKFPSVRPQWLLNKTGYPLEIDCYCEELRLGLEYNGRYHYKFPSKYCKSKAEFLELQERDKLKRELCNDCGISLITVPYTIKKDKLYEFIVDLILKL